MRCVDARKARALGGPGQYGPRFRCLKRTRRGWASGEISTWRLTATEKFGDRAFGGDRESRELQDRAAAGAREKPEGAGRGFGGGGAAAVAAGGDAPEAAGA